MLQAIGLWSVSSRNLYCCAVLASLLSRHKLSYYANPPGQHKKPDHDGRALQSLGVNLASELVEAKLHRRITAEDGHEHGELLSGGLHVGNNGGMVAKGPSVTVT